MGINADQNKQIFKGYYDKYIVPTKKGAADLWNWIESTDFFTAPASSKFHLNVSGGLCQHSLNVYHNLKRIVDMEKQMHPELNIKEESIAVCGLLHDLCKANFYKVESRNVKNQETGKWESVPCYVTDEQLPWGHGEKSVLLILRYMELSDEEIAAINWHMGGFDERVKGGASKSISAAYETYPLAVLTQAADFIVSYIDENR